MDTTLDHGLWTAALETFDTLAWTTSSFTPLTTLSLIHFNIHRHASL